MNFTGDVRYYDRQPGLSDEEIENLDVYLSSGLTTEEITELNQLTEKIGPIDYANWNIVEVQFPDDYKDLLRESNGGGMINGDREFGFFGKKELRDYYIGYCFPEFLPGAYPIGFNGGGVFYAYDFRNDEVPIIAVGSGNMCWEDTVVLANSIAEVMSKSENIEEELSSGYDHGSKADEQAVFERDMKRAIKRAEESFKKRDYSEVVEILSDYQEHLDEIRLKKLDYSRKKMLT